MARWRRAVPRVTLAAARSLRRHEGEQQHEIEQAEQTGRRRGRTSAGCGAVQTRMVSPAGGKPGEEQRFGDLLGGADRVAGMAADLPATQRLEKRPTAGGREQQARSARRSRTRASRTIAATAPMREAEQRAPASPAGRPPRPCRRAAPASSRSSARAPCCAKRSPPRQWRARASAGRDAESGERADLERERSREAPARR